MHIAGPQKGRQMSTLDKDLFNMNRSTSEVETNKMSPRGKIQHLHSDSDSDDNAPNFAPQDAYGIPITSP